MWLSSIRTMLMPFKSRYLPDRVNYFFQANHELILSVCVRKRWYTVVKGCRFPSFTAPTEFVECLRTCPLGPFETFIVLFFKWGHVRRTGESYKSHGMATRNTGLVATKTATELSPSVTHTLHSSVKAYFDKGAEMPYLSLLTDPLCT